MIILPAIDVKDGTCVRLVKGDYETAHKVAEDAVKTAYSFQNAGAKWLHMVDLDGAKAAKPVNSKTFFDVQHTCELNIEIGGGIRNMETVDFYLQHGISRVILGSAAISNPQFVQQAVNQYGKQIAVGIDARDGKVAAEGWTSTSQIDYIDMAKRMESIGVKYIIFTDISRDGTLSGPNLVMLDKINRAVSCNIIASGGVSSIKDIINLDALGVYGAICGKALYTGDLDLSTAITISKGAQ